MPTFADALNGQIGYEFAASQQYIAIAVYYDAENLPQLAAHFYRQAVEERNHAMMMVQYLLDADAPVEIPAIAAPQNGFSDIVGEGGLGRLDGRDDHVVAGVEEVLHHHHRVVPLLERLLVEVRRELRERLAVVVNRDRDVLLRRRELVRDLLVEFLLEGGHDLESIAPG